MLKCHLCDGELQERSLPRFSGLAFALGVLFWVGAIAALFCAIIAGATQGSGEIEVTIAAFGVVGWLSVMFGNLTIGSVLTSSVPHLVCVTCRASTRLGLAQPKAR